MTVFASPDQQFSVLREAGAEVRVVLHGEPPAEHVEELAQRCLMLVPQLLAERPAPQIVRSATSEAQTEG